MFAVSSAKNAVEARCKYIPRSDLGASMNIETASRRFDRTADNYATSEVHRTSRSMQLLHELLTLPPGVDLCDVACGTGHLALSFAGVAHRIVGVDPAPRMLAALGRLAQERGISVETVEAYSESLPFPDSSFDLVVSRLAPHHFRDIGRAISEMTRITRVGGHVGIIDLEGHSDPDVDAFNHEIELLHDPTHVRSYTVERWRALLDDAGLEIIAVHSRLRESADGVTIRRWCQIAASGAAAEEQIRRRLTEASAKVLDELRIVRDGDEFRVPMRTVLLIGRK
jgi:ubiquinone/menaquinone biosynthesis C-methylase UbiE